MAIAEELGDMVHGETYSVMEAKATSQERMRTLYLRTFRPGGVTVKAAFYDALRIHQPKLVERLGRISDEIVKYSLIYDFFKFLISLFCASGG